MNKSEVQLNRDPIGKRRKHRHEQQRQAKEEEAALTVNRPEETHQAAPQTSQQQFAQPVVVPVPAATVALIQCCSFAEQ